MNLEEVREHIDRIDAQLIKLFNERLDLAPRVVKAKLEMGKPVFDPGRERDKLAGIAQAAPQDRQAQLISLFSLLMNMNKIEQNRYLASLDQKPQSKRAINTLLPADAQFPVTASVACQGVEGAYRPARRLQALQGSLHHVFRYIRGRVKGGTRRPVRLRRATH